MLGLRLKVNNLNDFFEEEKIIRVDLLVTINNRKSKMQ